MKNCKSKGDFSSVSQKKNEKCGKHTIAKQYLYQTIRYTNKEKMGQQTQLQGAKERSEGTLAGEKAGIKRGKKG